MITWFRSGGVLCVYRVVEVCGGGVWWRCLVEVFGGGVLMRLCVMSENSPFVRMATVWVEIFVWGFRCWLVIRDVFKLSIGCTPIFFQKIHFFLPLLIFCLQSPVFLPDRKNSMRNTTHEMNVFKIWWLLSHSSTHSLIHRTYNNYTNWSETLLFHSHRMSCWGEGRHCGVSEEHYLDFHTSRCRTTSALRCRDIPLEPVRVETLSPW